METKESTSKTKISDFNFEGTSVRACLCGGELLFNAGELEEILCLQERNAEWRKDFLKFLLDNDEDPLDWGTDYSMSVGEVRRRIEEVNTPEAKRLGRWITRHVEPSMTSKVKVIKGGRYKKQWARGLVCMLRSACYDQNVTGH